jgi:DNA repair protein RecN (Recombination protein N)
MLLELRAENYAVIDHAVATLGPGLNLLTGETGAGKSILVDALSLLMGGKASSDVVRHGADKAVVTCVFESTAEVEAILEANGLDAEGPEIILRREIVVTGKGRVYVNNQPATASVLRQLAPELALVHAQSETRAGFDGAQQRLLLDRYAGISVESVAAAYGKWRGVAGRLAELEQDEQDRLRMADLWAFQSKEIGSAGLQPGEDEALATEKRIQANAEKLYAAAMTAYDLLYESNTSSETTLRSALKQVEELAKFDARFVEAALQLQSARAIAEDEAATVRDFGAGTQASPERLEEIEDRLALIDRLKRKYGATLDEVIAFGTECSWKLDEIENREHHVAALKKELAAAAGEYSAAAAELSEERAASARRLEKVVEQQINDLAMKAKFSIGVHPQEADGGWAPHGWDEVECRIATNAGEPLKPLEEIASGGEMSRVLLAIKVSVEEGAAKAGRKKRTALPRTLVFDEIDIGIAGTAGAVRDASAADCGVCRSALCGGEARGAGEDEDFSAGACRSGPAGGDCADVEWGEVDGGFTEECGAVVVVGEGVSGALATHSSRWCCDEWGTRLVGAGEMQIPPLRSGWQSVGRDDDKVWWVGTRLRGVVRRG